MGFDWWVKSAFESGGPTLVVSWVVVVIGSIVLHELAHGIAAMRLGDDTPRHAGHMTWNPLVHMGSSSLICFAIFGFAWGAMPVNPSNLRGRYASALVAVAGPLTNIVLAIVAAILGSIWIRFAAGIGSPMYENVNVFFGIACVLNIALAVFNMLPVMPLDGGRILADFVPAYHRLISSENGQWVMLGIFLLFFWFGSGPLFSIAIFARDGMFAMGEAALSII